MHNRHSLFTICIYLLWKTPVKIFTLVPPYVFCDSALSKALPFNFISHVHMCNFLRKIVNPNKVIEFNEIRDTAALPLTFVFNDTHFKLWYCPECLNLLKSSLSCCCQGKVRKVCLHFKSDGRQSNAVSRVRGCVLSTSCRLGGPGVKETKPVGYFISETTLPSIINKSTLARQGVVNFDSHPQFSLWSKFYCNSISAWLPSTEL